jgi:hypothetical protein
MLVPWLVFTLAAGLKFWRLTSVFRQHMAKGQTNPERFRQSLERIWQQDQQAASSSYRRSEQLKGTSKNLKRA